MAPRTALSNGDGGQSLAKVVTKALEQSFDTRKRAVRVKLTKLTINR